MKVTLRKNEITCTTNSLKHVCPASSNSQNTELHAHSLTALLAINC